MNDDRYNQLQKDINYANMEGFVEPDKELRVFRNAAEAINALRNNEIPGVNWTATDEEKYLQLINKEANASE